MFDFVNKLKDKGRWRIFKLKLIDARLYFVSIFVGAADGACCSALPLSIAVFLQSSSRFL